MHGTPTESGRDVAIKGERKSGKRTEKKDWSSHLMALLGMKIATRNNFTQTTKAFTRKFQEWKTRFCTSRHTTVYKSTL